MSSRIIVIPDVSYFKNKRKEVIFNKLNLENYYSFLKAIHCNGHENEISMHVPEVVLCQLIVHHKNDLKRVLEGKRNFKLKNITIDDLKKVNLEKYCKNLKETYFDKIELVKIPDDKEKLFNEILKRAIDKKPPFNKNSDPGFKSTVLFLSILNFIKSDDKVIIVSDREKFIHNRREAFEEMFREYFDNSAYSPTLEICTKKEFLEFLDDEYGVVLG